MGAALKFEIDGSAAKFEAALMQAERTTQMVAKRAERISESLGGFSPADRAKRNASRDQEIRDRVNAEKKAAQDIVAARKSAWKEELAAMRQGPATGFNTSAGAGGSAMRRARGLGGGASAMFVSVARDSAASLASGANPLTVFMQQAPQVMQAITMMGLSMKTLMGVVAPIGATIAAAFATHYVSKWVASVVYGIDKIADRGKQLEEARQRVRNFMQEIKEASKLKIDLYGEEFKGKQDEKSALSKKRRAELDAYKAELEKKNIAGMKLGNADMTQVNEQSVLKRERELLQQDLSDAESQGESPQTRKLQAELDELDKKGQLTESEHARRLSLQDQIGTSSRADDANKKAAIIAAQTALQENQNAMDKYGLPATPDGQTASRTGGGGKSVNMLTEWEKVGGSLGGQNLALDVSKAQLKELQDLNRHFRTGNGGRGVTY